MEFRRFGSIISGTYWGCCAICIIQNFNVDPDAAASMQQVHGDSGSPVGSPTKYAGKTYREMFETLIRTGTFSTRDMPNHAFLASLTSSQCNNPNGKKWLEILKANGFEFIRAVNNSVGSGSDLNPDPVKRTGGGAVYIFGLFRNIGVGALKNPFEPPKAWSDLPTVSPEANEFIQAFGSDIELFNNEQAIAQRKIWDAGKTKFYTEAELRAAGVPVWQAGKIGAKPFIKTEGAVKPAADPFTLPA